MNHSLSLVCLVSISAAAPVFAQGVSSASAPTGPVATTTGSVYVAVPSSVGGQNGASLASDPATHAISSATRAKADAAHAGWLARSGAEFYPKYTYAGGAPILMLMVAKNETPSGLARRYKAMVQACEFMLADDAFDHSVICVATYDGKDRLSMSTHNTTITRNAFHLAVQKAGNASDLMVALNAVYRTDGAVAQVCSDLGMR